MSWPPLFSDCNHLWSAEYLVDYYIYNSVKTNLLSLRSFGLPRGMSKSMRTQWQICVFHRWRPSSIHEKTRCESSLSASFSFQRWTIHHGNSWSFSLLSVSTFHGVRTTNQPKIRQTQTVLWGKLNSQVPVTKCLHGSFIRSSRLFVVTFTSM